MSEQYNVAELRKKAISFFQEKKIDEAILTADLLLADALGVKRFDLYLDFERPISAKELEVFRDYSRRRANGEPLQYILGNQWFFGLSFIVNPSVLIPRPETELLVELILDKMSPTAHLLDIGTGSGAIAISIASKFPNAHIVGIDVSNEALAVAKQNIDKHAANNVSLKSMDILKENLATDFNNIDVIVSNPPYIPLSEKNSMQREIVEHEPPLALFTETGLEFYERISSEAKASLKQKGLLFFEIHSEKEKEVTAILEQHHFSNIQTFSDLQGMPRVICGTKS